MVESLCRALEVIRACVGRRTKENIVKVYSTQARRGESGGQVLIWRARHDSVICLILQQNFCEGPQRVRPWGESLPPALPCPQGGPDSTLS